MGDTTPRLAGNPGSFGPPRRETTIRTVFSVVTILCVFAFVPTPSTAEVSVGITGGVVFAGDQDLTLRQYGADRELLSGTKQKFLHPSTGPLGGLTVTAWGHQWPWLGIQLDAMYWATSVDTRREAAQPASRLAIDQERTALLVSLLGRLPLDGDSGTFLYGGLSGGAVHSRVRFGDTKIRAAFGLLGGVAVPLISRLRLRTEVRYLVTPDSNATPRPGLRVDTSGSSGVNPGRLLFTSHMDTQFVPVLFGLDWVF